jgi:hypothetical protein
MDSEERKASSSYEPPVLPRIIAGRINSSATNRHQWAEQTAARRRRPATCRTWLVYVHDDRDARRKWALERVTVRLVIRASTLKIAPNAKRVRRHSRSLNETSSWTERWTRNNVRGCWRLPIGAPSI